MARGSDVHAPRAAGSAPSRRADGRPARRRGDSHLRTEPVAVARNRGSRCGRQCVRLGSARLGTGRHRRGRRLPGHRQLRRRVLDRDGCVAAEPKHARRLPARRAHLRAVSAPRLALHPSGPALALPLRARRSGRAGRGSGHPCGSPARSQVGARGRRPCARRPRDARTRRLPHPGFAVLRPA